MSINDILRNLVKYLDVEIRFEPFEERFYAQTLTAQFCDRQETAANMISVYQPRIEVLIGNHPHHLVITFWEIGDISLISHQM